MSNTNKIEYLNQRSKQIDDILSKLQTDIRAIIKTKIQKRHEEQTRELEAENDFLRSQCELLKNKIIKYEDATLCTSTKQAGGDDASLKSDVKPEAAPKSEEDPKTEAAPKLEEAPKAEAAPKKGQKKANKPKKAPAEPEDERAVDISRLDLRVGKILEAKKHPDADSLYVEEIDVGEEKPRTVVSGLVRFIPIEEMQQRMVVVLCNLKPAKMRGVLSQAMVMCASTAEKVEILCPPPGAAPGDVVTFEGYPGKPDDLLNPKKKIFEQVAPDLKTDQDLNATYKGVPFTVANKGVVKTASLANVIIK